MTTATPEQFLDRLEALSPKLQDAFYSYEVTKQIWSAAERLNLKEKEGDVAGVVGYALAAFVHPDALALELKEALDIDETLAKKLADELNKSVFAPYRAEIEKAYAPPGKPTPKAPLPPQPATTAPKVADVTPRPAPLPPVANSKEQMANGKASVPVPPLPSPVNHTIKDEPTVRIGLFKTEDDIEEPIATR